MVNNTIATRWLLSKKDFLKLSFIEHKDSQQLLPNLTDIEVKVYHDDKVFSGRGTDAIGDLALEKASSEAIERWCCDELKISTVGCAIHSIEEKSKLNSLNEFLERYYFDKFIEGQISVTYLQSNVIDSETQMNFYEIAKASFGSIIICLVFDKSLPIVLGLSLERELQAAINKSSIEALRNYAVYKASPDNFNRSVKNDKNLWCCEHNFIKTLYNIINSESKGHSQIEEPRTNTKTIKASSILKMEDCPLYFSRSILGSEL